MLLMSLNYPKSWNPVHKVFYVSLLKKFIGDPVSILRPEGLGVDASISYEEFPIEILERQKVRKYGSCFIIGSLEESSCGKLYMGWRGR